MMNIVNRCLAGGLIGGVIRSTVPFVLSALAAVLLLIGKQSSAQTPPLSISPQMRDLGSVRMSDLIDQRNKSEVKIIPFFDQCRDIVCSNLKTNEFDDDEKKSTQIQIQRETIGKEPIDSIQEVFETDKFKNATTEEKWKMLPINKQTNINDLIRNLTPEQLGSLFDLAQPCREGPCSVEKKQVAPGTPTPPQNFPRQCTGQWCGSPKPQKITVNEDSGYADITYRENAYEQVVVLQPGRIGNNPNENRCTATLIAPGWVLSALHCFGKSGNKVRKTFNISSASVGKWLELTPNNKSVFAISLSINGKVSAYLVDKVYVPYVNAIDIRYQSGAAPPKDIALFSIKINDSEMTKFSTYPKFAKMDKVVEGAAVTFVGYGWTDVKEYDWTKSKQAAFNWLTASDNNAVQWQTGNWTGNGGPCLGDSGGPIFMEFIRGYSDEQAHLAGVVSRLFNGNIVKGADCLNKTGEGEPLYPYIDDICAITSNEPADCP